jgi:hypothetical protein
MMVIFVKNIENYFIIKDNNINIFISEKKNEYKHEYKFTHEHHVVHVI